jgi:hypothetical protein
MAKTTPRDAQSDVMLWSSSTAPGIQETQKQVVATGCPGVPRRTVRELLAAWDATPAPPAGAQYHVAAVGDVNEHAEQDDRDVVTDIRGGAHIGERRSRAVVSTAAAVTVVSGIVATPAPRAGAMFHAAAASDVYGHAEQDNEGVVTDIRGGARIREWRSRAVISTAAAVTVVNDIEEPARERVRARSGGGSRCGEGLRPHHHTVACPISRTPNREREGDPSGENRMSEVPSCSAAGPTSTPPPPCVLREGEVQGHVEPLSSLSRTRRTVREVLEAWNSAPVPDGAPRRTC